MAGNHDHHAHDVANEKPLGNVDIAMGLIIFAVLYFITYKLAGPDGYAFLKGYLNPDLGAEMFISGCLLLLLWCVCSPLFVEPYLQAYYEREEKTSGMVSGNASLRSELAELKKELSAEIRNAKLEGVRRKSEKVAEAKRQGADVIEAGRKEAASKWEATEKELNALKDELTLGAREEVPALASKVVSKISEDFAKVVH